MIFNLIINLILLVFGTLFVFLPIVSIDSIPVIGSTISVILITMSTTWNAFIETFPYVRLPFLIFLAVILPFEVLMLITKFFLGARKPTNE